eukprot:5294129-Pleurochrysis_carterae.AAC.1
MRVRTRRRPLGLRLRRRDAIPKGTIPKRSSFSQASRRRALSLSAAAAARACVAAALATDGAGAASESAAAGAAAASAEWQLRPGSRAG